MTRAVKKDWTILITHCTTLLVSITIHSFSHPITGRGGSLFENGVVMATQKEKEKLYYVMHIFFLMNIFVFFKK